jgi:hypothetical protein
MLVHEARLPIVAAIAFFACSLAPRDLQASVIYSNLGAGDSYSTSGYFLGYRYKLHPDAVLPNFSYARN